MIELKDLLAFAETHASEKMVLATLIETRGSTYSKAGAKKLITANGPSCGVLTGGCLEGEIIDLAIQNASRVHIHSIDTREESDRFVGSGIGCQGFLRILFEPVEWRDSRHFAQTYLAYENEDEGVSLCCVNPESEHFGRRHILLRNNPPGSSWIGEPAQVAQLRKIENDDYFIEPWRSDLNVSIFGAGLDVEPLKELIECMGWALTIYEHRPDWVEQRSAEKWPIQLWDRNPENMASPSGGKRALLLMSHNYEQDLNFLYQWIRKKISTDYIGVLGPKKRKDQMIVDLVDVHRLSEDGIPLQLLHGPMGDKSHGRSSRAIALSIVSELQKKFFGQATENVREEADCAIVPGFSV